jgi:hypothetical protein
MSVIDIDALREESLATEEGKAFAQGYEVRCRGIEFRVPPVSLWPLAVFRAQAKGDQYAAVAALLGDDTAEKLSDAGMVLDDLERIAKAIPAPAGAQGPPTKRSSAPGG